MKNPSSRVTATTSAMTSFGRPTTAVTYRRSMISGFSNSERISGSRKSLFGAK